MSGSAAIVELLTPDERRDAYPVMAELRPALTLDRYLTLLEEMVPARYRMFALRESGEILALAGVAVCVNLYHGRHLWVYDLVTVERARSRGYGAQLLRYLEALARDLGCERAALSSGFARVEAHRFYTDRMGYEKRSFVFVKDLP